MNMRVKYVDAVAVTVSPEITELAKNRQEEAMAEARPKAEKIKRDWMETRRASIAKKSDLSDHQINGYLKRVIDNNELPPCFEIEVKCPQSKSTILVSVADILSNIKLYHNARTRDPIEPEYGEGRFVGILYLNRKTPVLYSYAHGGSSYTLTGTTKKPSSSLQQVEFATHLNADFVDRCIEILRSTGEFFRSGSILVQMVEGEFRQVCEHRLLYELSSIVQPIRMIPGENGPEPVNIEFTRRMLSQILLFSSERMKPLFGCTDYPLVLPNGSIISKPGYDDSSGLFVRNGRERFPEIFEKPTAEQLQQSVETCLRPFRRYRYDDNVSGRTAALVAVMIAVLRPVFGCAPLILTTSNKTGVGKGYFQQALAILRTGRLAELRNIERSNQSEFRKMLFTQLLEGKTVIALDNIDGPLKNETLSSFITAEVWNDRILGQSKTGGSLRNDALLLLNGCRVDLGKNLVRKVLRIGLTEPCDGHRFHDFGFLPHKEALKHRNEIISAVLTLACHAKYCDGIKDTIGSFEEVNDLIRRPIANIAERFPALKLSDPLRLFKELIDNDIDSPEETNFLHLIYDVIGEREFDSKDLYEMLERQPILETAYKEFTGFSSSKSSKSVGVVLKQLSDEAHHGLILNARKVGGKNHWWFKKLD